MERLRKALQAPFLFVGGRRCGEAGGPGGTAVCFAQSCELPQCCSVLPWAHLALKALNKPSQFVVDRPFGWGVNFVNTSFSVEPAAAKSFSLICEDDG